MIYKCIPSFFGLFIYFLHGVIGRRKLLVLTKSNLSIALCYLFLISDNYFERDFSLYVRFVRTVFKLVLMVK